MNELINIDEANINNKIFTVRGLSIMLDRDLAELYGVETKHINQAVKNNQDKFQEDFFFQLTDDEFDILRSNHLTTNFSKTRINPKVFTEEGIYMLATILKSKIASDITVSIIRTFAKIRKLILSNNSTLERFERVEQRLSLYDNNFDKIFKALDSNEHKPTQGIFYDGQVFDAYNFVSDLIRSAKNSIVLIDNYIDDSVLTLFSKNQDIDVTIYTKNITKQLKLDIEKYNAQYPKIEIKKFDDSHDRFLILDDKEVYHIGASLKDLGKKWFAFSKLDVGSFGIFDRLGGCNGIL
ncbi:MAG: ORF6N domain-containing protein [Epsilonproteobacteria bacterium]|nr:MAG: ORF6N domain-containing protein [Campylobacterota bacterium]